MLINKKSPHGGDIYTHAAEIDFSANINPFGMPEKVRAALISAASDCSAYPDPYCTELREKIAAVWNVPSDDILCGNGASELIYAFSYSLPKGKPALIVAPTFCEYAQSLSAAGIDAEYYYLAEENGFRLTEDILRLDFSQYCAVFLCSPNNPTGITVSPKLIEGIADSKVRLFCDFCFLDMTENPQIYDIPRLSKKYPNIAVLLAFTKGYAMAGVRLGYVIYGDGEFLNTMSEKTPCWNVSTLAQKAGVAALDCGDWLGGCVRLIAAERRRAAEELLRLGIRVFPGESNYLLLYSPHNLAEELLGRGIMVRDCRNYAGLGVGYIRIAVRTPEENNRLIEAVRDITEKNL